MWILVSACIHGSKICGYQTYGYWGLTVFLEEAFSKNATILLQ